MRSVRALCVFRRQQMSWKERLRLDLSGLTTTGGHSVRAVIVNVHVGQWKVTPSVVPDALQASVCDEQLKSMGGEIALSGNSFAKKKKHKGGTEGYEVVSVCPQHGAAFSKWRWMHGDAQPCTKPIPIMTWHIANSPFTPASRQPYMLLSKRPTLLLPVQASAGSFHKHLPLGSTCQGVPGARLSTSRPQVRSAQLDCPTTLGSSSIVAQCSKLREASSGGVAVKNDQIFLTFALLHDQSTAVIRFVFHRPCSCQPTACQTRPRRAVCQQLSRHQVHEWARFPELLTSRQGCCWATCHSCHRCNPNRTRSMGKVSWVPHTLASRCQSWCTLATWWSRCRKMSKSTSSLGALSLCHHFASALPSTSEPLRSPSAFRFKAVRLSKISFCSPCSFLFQAFSIRLCSSLARHGCLLAANLHFGVTFRVWIQVLFIWKSDAFVLTRATWTDGVSSLRVLQFFDDAIRFVSRVLLWLKSLWMCLLSLRL